MVLDRKGIRLLNADVLSVGLEPSSVDLIVTSPPYGVDIKYATFADDLPYEAYLDFTRKWLSSCLGFLKSDGRLCLNLPLDKNKGGQQSVYSDVLQVAKTAGWKYFSTIIWNEQNISRRTAWGSWLSASAPYVIAPVEVVVLLYKGTWEKASKGESDVARDDFIAWTNGMWTFGGETRDLGHPAPFPIELPRRCITLFSYVGDTVLDPFAGSGSTLLACLETRRRGIGVEISKTYCDLIKKRLTQAHLFERRLDEAPGDPASDVQAGPSSSAHRTRSGGS
ncbi:MAG: site-specific DNA-methyltransferase [Euryarchaeota archaeon]|nr:site-specific DNA-methyltransferase [Euryarchaeota archaeon]MDE1835967.1 site-specific DNA-methyltransferase [Euryarchaeota archaeon]MDE1882072.1 site-specific DNA-methyltransferase [Euryarchaeota archaeon]MDE2044355.1 site-specific DNA-methyltransferase [Thermoplasmata archaeon]